MRFEISNVLGIEHVVVEVDAGGIVEVTGANAAVRRVSRRRLKRCCLCK